LAVLAQLYLKGLILMFALSPARPGRLLLGGLCVLVLLSGGCTGKSKARVKGTITFKNGQPMSGGTVTFVAADKRQGTTHIDAKGNYDLADAPVGDVRIYLTVPPPAMGPSAGKQEPPPGTGKMKSPDGGGPPDPGASSTVDPRNVSRVPEKYLSPDSSGLTYTVTRGEQTHPITLEW